MRSEQGHTAVTGMAAIDDQDELVRRAVSWIPTLRARGEECERQRRIPQQTIDEFIAHGFHRISQPRRFGGMGHGLDVAMEVAMEVGRGCGSTAWMASQWPGHNMMVGMFPMQAQEEYWADSRDRLCSTASAGGGSFIEVEGGARVSGRWKFSSGIDGSHWVMAVAQNKYCLIPSCDYTIIDDWHVSGLRGSGSKSIAIESFVPDHRIFDSSKIYEGHTLGREYYDSPFYRLPLLLFAPPLLCASTIGAAQGAADLFEERVLTRIEPLTGQPAREGAGNQLRFAEATAEIDAARLILRQNNRELIEWGAADEAISPIEMARSRRNVTFAAKLSLQAAERLFASGDSSGIYNVNGIERFVRDVQAGVHHMGLMWDETAMHFARQRWNASSPSPGR